MSLRLASALMMVTALFLAVPERAGAAQPCDLPLVREACKAAGEVGDTATGAVKGALEDPLGTLKDGAGGVAGKIGEEVKEAVGGALESAAGGVFDQLTSWVGEAAGWLFLKVVALINSTTSPNLFKPAYLAKYRQILALASVLAVGVVCLAVIEGGRRGDTGALMAVLLAGLPLAMLGTVLSLVVIQIALNVVDALSLGVAKATASDIRAWFKAGSAWMIESSVQPATPGDVAAVATGDKPPPGPAVPGFVLLVTSLLAIVGALGLWLELLMRDAAIYVCALFMPLGLAASVWPRWAGVARRTMEILIVLVISKFFIVMVISLAAGFIGKPDSVETALAGAAMLIVALLMPFMLLRVIPMMEGAAMTRGAAGMSRTGTSAAMQANMVRQSLSATSRRPSAATAGAGTSAGSGGIAPQAMSAGVRSAGTQAVARAGQAAAGAAGGPAAGGAASASIGAGKAAGGGAAGGRPGSSSSGEARAAGRSGAASPAGGGGGSGSLPLDAPRPQQSQGTKSQGSGSAAAAKPQSQVASAGGTGGEKPTAKPRAGQQTKPAGSPSVEAADVSTPEPPSGPRPPRPSKEKS